MTVLVTGGTGRLGRALVPLLPDVRVLSRHPGPGRSTDDLVTGRGLAEAVAGVRVAVHLATARTGDAAATARLVAALPRGTHLLYVSIVGADRIPLGYYREKIRCEEVVTGSRLPWTILRATQFPELLATVFGALSRTGLLPVLADTAFQPVAVDDVAARLARLVAGPAAGRVDDLGGPEVLSMAELARTWLWITGTRRRVLPVPMPGAVARGYREGHHLAPTHADGVVTFAQALDRRRP